MGTKSILLIILTALTFLISACTISYTTVINDDESGQVTIKFTLTEEDIENIEDELDEDFEDILEDEMGEDSIEDACAEIEDDIYFTRKAEAKYSERAGKFTCEIIIPFDDIEELLEIYREFDLGYVKDIDLDRDGDFTYDMDVDMRGVPEPDDVGLDDVEIFWIVTVPGSIEKSNADDVSGRTLTWNLDPGYIHKVEVIGGPGGIFSSGLSFLLFGGFGLMCLFGLALVGGGAGFYFYTQNKKKAEAKS